LYIRVFGYWGAQNDYTLSVSSEDPPDGGWPVDGGMPLDGGMSCDQQPFNQAMGWAVKYPNDSGDKDSWKFVTHSRPEFFRMDNLAIFNYASRGGLSSAPASGVLTADDTSLATCRICALLQRECNQYGSCNKTFMPQAGAGYDLQSLGLDPGQLFAGSLSSLVMQEVTVGANLETTVVPGGETFCIDSFVFSEPICQDDRLEYLGSTAGLLDEGTLANLMICPFNYDWWAVQPTNAGQLVVMLTFDQRQGDLGLELLEWVNNSTVFLSSSNTYQSVETVRAEVVPGKTYFMKVYGSMAASNNYDIHIDLP